MKKSILFRYLLFMAVFFAAWVLLDYLFAKKMMMQVFRFNMFGDVVQPLLLGTAIAYFTFIRKELKQ